MVTFRCPHSKSETFKFFKKENYTHLLPPREFLSYKRHPVLRLLFKQASNTFNTGSCLCYGPGFAGTKVSGPVLSETKHRATSSVDRLKTCIFSGDISFPAKCSTKRRFYSFFFLYFALTEQSGGVYSEHN